MQRRVHERFSLENLSQHHIYTIPDTSCFDYPWWKAKNDWRSVDALLHHGAGNVPVSLFPIMVASTMLMHSNDQISSGLPDLHDQDSLMLRCHVYWEWCGDHVALSFANKASQYRIYEWPQPIATQITNNSKPKIVDAPLTLIFRMGQAAYGSLVCLKSQPIPHLWLAVTDYHSDY